MSKKIPDNQFLARWMNGELEPEEQQEWEASEGYQRWQQIQQALENRALSPMNTEFSYQHIQEKKDKNSRPLTFVRRRIYWASGIAAAVLITLAFFFFSPSTQSWSAPLAEQVTVELPDGSTAMLNAGTDLSYQTSRLSDKRVLKLDGEAFFNVQSGAPFIVNTQLGKVEVLGTQFNVKGRGEEFEVYCVEGKVAVFYVDEEYILTAGQGIRPMEQQTPYRHTATQPAWSQGNSLFQNTPLNLVFDEVERQFGVTIEYPDLSDRRYSGRFSHDNLDYALNIICGAMNLSYKFEGEKRVIVSE